MYSRSPSRAFPSNSPQPSQSNAKLATNPNYDSTRHIHTVTYGEPCSPIYAPLQFYNLPFLTFPTHPTQGLVCYIYNRFFPLPPALTPFLTSNSETFRVHTFT